VLGFDNRSATVRLIDAKQNMVSSFFCFCVYVSVRVWWLRKWWEKKIWSFMSC